MDASSIFTPVNLFFLLLFTFLNGMFTELLRRIFEHLLKGAKDSFWWADVGLYVLPIGVGALLAFATHDVYPFPEIFTTITAKVAMGAASGPFAAVAYKVGKNIGKKKLKGLVTKESKEEGEAAAKPLPGTVVTVEPSEPTTTTTDT